MNRRLIGLAAAVLATGLLRAEELTLDQAIHQALQSNRSVLNASLETSKFEARRASLKSQMLPSAQVLGMVAQPLAPFSFLLGKGALGNDTGGGPIPRNDVNLQTPTHPIGLFAVNVIQPLSSIPTIHKGLGLLDIQKKLTEEQARLERQTLVRDVRQLYYGIQTLDSSLKAARESVKLFGEVVRVTAEYAEKRQVLDVDYLDAQVHLAKATETVLDLENQRENLKAKLNYKLGREVTSEFTVTEVSSIADPGIPTALQDVAEARQKALAQRPEARQAQLKIDQAKAEMRIARAGFDPTIAAQFTGIETTPINSLLPRQVGIAGVSVTWEPFTWGRKKNELALRREELQEAVNRNEDAKSQVAIDVAEQFRKLKLASAKLHVASLTRQMAAESLRVNQKQYEVRFSLLKSVLQAQAALEGANAEYQKSLGELWTARAEYDRAVGDEQ